MKWSFKNKTVVFKAIFYLKTKKPGEKSPGFFVFKFL